LWPNLAYPDVPFRRPADLTGGHGGAAKYLSLFGAAAGRLVGRPPDSPCPPRACSSPSPNLVGARSPQRRGAGPVRSPAWRWAATRDPVRESAGLISHLRLPLSVSGCQSNPPSPSNPTETWRQYHSAAPMMPDPHRLFWSLEAQGLPRVIHTRRGVRQTVVGPWVTGGVGHRGSGRPPKTFLRLLARTHLERVRLSHHTYPVHRCFEQETANRTISRRPRRVAGGPVQSISKLEL